MIFEDRKDAGQKLISKLHEYEKKSDAIILALPRGGIILAYEIAKELQVPLDLIIAQKIGAPNFQELAIGAVSEKGDLYFDDNIISTYSISRDYIEQETKKMKKKAIQRANLYRKNQPSLNIKAKIAMLVDDGIATGSTMLAAIKSVRSQKAKKIIIAVPVIASKTLQKIEKEVDQIVYLDAPESLGAISEFYENFEQVNDNIVIDLLEKARKR